MRGLTSITSSFLPIHESVDSLCRSPLRLYTWKPCMTSDDVISQVTVAIFTSFDSWQTQQRNRQLLQVEGIWRDFLKLIDIDVRMNMLCSKFAEKSGKIVWYEKVEWISATVNSSLTIQWLINQWQDVPGTYHLQIVSLFISDSTRLTKCGIYQ